LVTTNKLRYLSGTSRVDNVLGSADSSHAYDTLSAELLMV